MTACRAVKTQSAGLNCHYRALFSVLSEVDWQLAETSTRLPSKPKRDLIAYDGQKLTLGDTTITMYLTPGHTLGTISTLVPVRDGGRVHLAAEWGGTGFNFEHSRARFETYAASAQRFGTIVAQAGADVPGQLPRQNGRARKAKSRGPAPVL